MTQDEIIRMAREAGWKSDRLTAVNAEEQDRKLQKFAALVAEATKERVLACYSPEDTANDWADKIKGLK